MNHIEIILKVVLGIFSVFCIIGAVDGIRQSNQMKQSDHTHTPR